MLGYTFDFTPVKGDELGKITVTASHMGLYDVPIVYIEPVVDGIFDVDFTVKNFWDYSIIREIYWGLKLEGCVTFDTFEYDETASDITVTVDYGENQLNKMISSTVDYYNELGE